jgi:hypothetical protein
MNATRPTRVVSLKGQLHEYGPELERAPKGLLYVGRVNKRGKNHGSWNLEQSPFANRYSVKKHRLAGSLALFVQDVIDRPELVEAIRGHAGGIFACWCGDDPGLNECHAAIWAFVADGGDPSDLVAKPAPRVEKWVDFGGRMDAATALRWSRNVETVRAAGDWGGAL